MKPSKLLNATSVALVITDIRMPGADGFDLIRHVRENFKRSEVLAITGFPTVKGAVRAIKAGAEEYLAKPFTDEELFEAVDRALDKLRVRKKAEWSPPTSAGYGLIGESKAMAEVFGAIAKAAANPATVLIQGESGTGKEIIARAVHYSSKRASFPFVPVNCGSIPEQLLESELFGHVKGAFTGAASARAGFFQTADRGTILLDEISEASLSMQVKLLRVLQEKEICMVGSSTPRKVDVRITAATNKDLFALIGKGLFREDLFYRLNVITIKAPPLRERGDDIILLARHFHQEKVGGVRPEGATPLRRGVADSSKLSLARKRAGIGERGPKTRGHDGWRSHRSAGSAVSHAVFGPAYGGAQPHAGRSGDRIYSQRPCQRKRQ